MLRQAVRAAAAPVSCAAVAIGLLSGWVSIGGAGTITVTKVPRIQISVATIPMHSLHPGAASAPQPDAPCYLTIHNSAGSADVLTAVSSPVARRVVLTAPAGARRRVVTGLGIPAHGTLTLTPAGDDAVLVGGPLLLAGQQVTLTLTFRRAGRVVIVAAVTVPGPP